MFHYPSHRLTLAVAAALTVSTVASADQAGDAARITALSHWSGTSLTPGTGWTLYPPLPHFEASMHLDGCALEVDLSEVDAAANRIVGMRVGIALEATTIVMAEDGRRYGYLPPAELLEPSPYLPTLPSDAPEQEPLGHGVIGLESAEVMSLVRFDRPADTPRLDPSEVLTVQPNQQRTHGYQLPEIPDEASVAALADALHLYITNYCRPTS